LDLCREAGLVKLGNVAIDGAKSLANASRKRSLSYQKLRDREQKPARAVEDAMANPPDSAAEKERRRDGAKKRLKRARQNADSPRRQYNFVDPDSRVMINAARQCYVQAYNAQVVADSHAQVIVVAEVTQQVNDKQQLVPMTQAVQENTGSNPHVVTAGCGYWDTNSLQDPVMRGIEVLVAPDAQPQPPGAPLPGNAPNNAEAKRMREVPDSDSGRTKYRLRKAIIEPVFGRIKEARGIRRFRLRGLEPAACEWKLICGMHNLLKLYRHRHPSPQTNRVRRASSLSPRCCIRPAKGLSPWPTLVRTALGIRGPSGTILQLSWSGRRPLGAGQSHVLCPPSPPFRFQSL